MVSLRKQTCKEAEGLIADRHTWRQPLSIPDPVTKCRLTDTCDFQQRLRHAVELRLLVEHEGSMSSRAARLPLARGTRRCLVADPTPVLLPGAKKERDQSVREQVEKVMQGPVPPTY